jgi:hypothetical protein
VLAKSFSELLHYFVRVRRVRRGQSFGTQFADSIFQTTRWHECKTSQAIGSVSIAHRHYLFDTAFTVGANRHKTGCAMGVQDLAVFETLVNR